MKLNLVITYKLFSIFKFINPIWGHSAQAENLLSIPVLIITVIDTVHRTSEHNDVKSIFVMSYD